MFGHFWRLPDALTDRGELKIERTRWVLAGKRLRWRFGRDLRDFWSSESMFGFKVVWFPSFFLRPFLKLSPISVWDFPCFFKRSRNSGILRFDLFLIWEIFDHLKTCLVSKWCDFPGFFWDLFWSFPPLVCGIFPAFLSVRGTLGSFVLIFSWSEEKVWFPSFFLRAFLQLFPYSVCDFPCFF